MKKRRVNDNSVGDAPTGDPSRAPSDDEVRTAMEAASSADAAVRARAREAVARALELYRSATGDGRATQPEPVSDDTASSAAGNEGR